ncbi:electron transfer flavoprotein subunit alpha/beta [Caballeronia arvi]|uniref:Electron transfer flavoprotein subunit alpha/beta n=1 Tax=Caballeronia arvi TaxID=1777135 RepID=A0A158KZP0_9BURK|nr:electron transfer flavoprotein subunit alpha/FixB family protein [Caballeronia arvi]SAL86618.1 electron transfer flavoprotein subunit alpha/beta [Caballeronia arvi]
MSVLVIAEHDNQTLGAATPHAVTAATQLGSDIDVLVAGAQCANVAARAACIADVRRVIAVDAAHYRHALAGNLAALIVTLAGEYSRIVAPATTTAKNVMPRVAALLDVAQVSDVVAIRSANTFVHPIYAGNVLAAVRSPDPVKIVTVRTTAFAAAEREGGNGEIVTREAAAEARGARFVSQQLTRSARAELTSAQRVISGGRGMGAGEHFALLEDVADKLGAAVGASRAAVDAGFAPNDWWTACTSFSTRIFSR